MSENDYEIGKGKPPKKHQFKPGQSGNPKGRPKGSKNVHHVLSKILGEKITITDAGRKMVVDKLEGAMRVMVNKSFEGSPSSLKLLLEVLEYSGGSGQSPAANSFTDEGHGAARHSETREHLCPHADDPRHAIGVPQSHETHEPHDRVHHPRPV